MMETLVINFILSDLWYKKFSTLRMDEIWIFMTLFSFLFMQENSILDLWQDMFIKKVFIYGMLSSNHKNAKKKHIFHIKHIKVSISPVRSIVNLIFIKYQTDLTLRRTKNVNIMDNVRAFLSPIICFANEGAKEQWKIRKAIKIAPRMLERNMKMFSRAEFSWPLQ